MPPGAPSLPEPDPQADTLRQECGKAIGIAAGAFYRISAALFAIGFTEVFLLDQARYLNHFYLVCLLSFLFVVIPAHRMWSVDGWIRASISAQRMNGPSPDPLRGFT